ncbi:hypothetical protein NDU88_005952 [Pleurodeles waltl]|uniref:Uncharacterized protein n=1 Tax=Pleurodeles waltl TaxID=8319 RepID=A0AAV7MXW9_PLEWA|nr:hypothetical protein NDU88_005952 [Pleurodeles waltl]
MFAGVVLQSNRTSQDPVPYPRRGRPAPAKPVQLGTQQRLVVGGVSWPRAEHTHDARVAGQSLEDARAAQNRGRSVLKGSLTRVGLGRRALGDEPVPQGQLWVVFPVLSQFLPDPCNVVPASRKLPCRAVKLRLGAKCCTGP